MAGNTKTVFIELFSDGDASHVPKTPDSTLVDPPTIYLEKLAAQWMEARGEARYGVNYKLDKLPDGYRLYERPRPGNTKLVDKHLYGHPQHRFFDSPNRFYKHFEHLMNHKTNLGCPCTVCSGSQRGPRPQSTVKRQGPRPGPPLTSVSATNTFNAKRLADEERTPDVFRRMIDKLERFGDIDQNLNEVLSMDWRVERNQLPQMLEILPTQPAWLPRVGEIVLFARDLNGEISFDEASKSYKIFDEDEQRFAGPPRWEAAVIGQVPTEPVNIQDVLQEGTKLQNVTYSGFRVEPYPDPNEHDKRYTKQYKYVPLHHIRPFVFWQDLLNGVPESEWHPTILNALKIMSSLSLIEKHRFKGRWPTASILCKGMFVGAEMICIGDAVRLLPQGTANEITDVLYVQAIKLQLTNLDKASNDDNDGGHPYNSTVFLEGKAFTTSRSYAWDRVPLSMQQMSQGLPNGMKGYKEWFCLHDPRKQYKVSFNRVVGRCFEAENMQLCFPSTDNGGSSQSSSLNKGLSGVRDGRAFSSQADLRIESGKSWFWGDSRCEVLDIETLNSVEVSVHNPERDDDLLVGWRAVIRVLDKTADRGTAHQASLVERPRVPKAMSSSMGKAALHREDVLSSVEEDDHDDVNNREESVEILDERELLRQFQPQRKRSHSVAEHSQGPSSTGSDSSGGAFHHVNEAGHFVHMQKPIVMVPQPQQGDQASITHEYKKPRKTTPLKR